MSFLENTSSYGDITTKSMRSFQSLTDPASRENNSSSNMNQEIRLHSNQPFSTECSVVSDDGSSPHVNRSSSSPELLTGSQASWSRSEHDAFLKGLRIHGKNWNLISADVVTKNEEETKIHAEDFFLRKSKMTCMGGGVKKEATKASNKGNASVAALIGKPSIPSEPNSANDLGTYNETSRISVSSAPLQFQSTAKLIQKTSVANDSNSAEKLYQQTPVPPQTAVNPVPVSAPINYSYSSLSSPYASSPVQYTNPLSVPVVDPRPLAAAVASAYPPYPYSFEAVMAMIHSPMFATLMALYPDIATRAADASRNGHFDGPLGVTGPSDPRTVRPNMSTASVLPPGHISSDPYFNRMYPLSAPSVPSYPMTSSLPPPALTSAPAGMTDYSQPTSYAAHPQSSSISQLANENALTAQALRRVYAPGRELPAVVSAESKSPLYPQPLQQPVGTDSQSPGYASRLPPPSSASVQAGPTIHHGSLSSYMGSYLPAYQSSSLPLQQQETFRTSPLPALALAGSQQHAFQSEMTHKSHPDAQEIDDDEEESPDMMAAQMLSSLGKSRDQFDSIAVSTVSETTKVVKANATLTTTSSGVSAQTNSTSNQTTSVLTAPAPTASTMAVSASQGAKTSVEGSKKRYRHLTLADKYEIVQKLRYYDLEARTAKSICNMHHAIALEYDVCESTIYQIVKQQDAIEKRYFQLVQIGVVDGTASGGDSSSSGLYDISTERGRKKYKRKDDNGDDILSCKATSSPVIDVLPTAVPTASCN